MHKPESVRENEIHKILRDLEIQMDYLVPARKPDLILINEKAEKNCPVEDFAVQVEY